MVPRKDMFGSMSARTAKSSHPKTHNVRMLDKAVSVLEDELTPPYHTCFTRLGAFETFLSRVIQRVDAVEESCTSAIMRVAREEARLIEEVKQQSADLQFCLKSEASRRITALRAQELSVRKQICELELACAVAEDALKSANPVTLSRAKTYLLGPLQWAKKELTLAADAELPLTIGSSSIILGTTTTRRAESAGPTGNGVFAVARAAARF